MSAIPTRFLGFIGALMVVPFLHHPKVPEAGAAPGRRVAAATRSPWAPDLPKQEGAANALAAPAVIVRDRNGAFHLDGMINGRSVRMLVDTGATIVAVPADQAAALGIVVHPDEFTETAQTASGSASMAVVRIDSLMVGGTELRGVEAAVVPGLDRVLLGQTALRRLGKVSIDGDHMEIGGN